MTTKVRVWLAILTLAAVLIIVSLTGPTRAAGDKDMRPDVLKIGDMYKAGKAADAEKTAPKIAKAFDETSDLMHLFRARNKGGMGWGIKSITKNPADDGLEKKLQTLANSKMLANVDTEAAAAEQAAYALAAMAQLIRNKTPAKDEGGGKTKKAWNDFAEQMREASIDFAKAAKDKNANAIIKAAAKVNSTCNGCHAKFKST